MSFPNMYSINCGQISKIMQCDMILGSVAAAVTTPLDVAKTRVMLATVRPLKSS